MNPAAQSYLEKWRQRCPELRLIEVFHRGVEGARQLAWACMLSEWEEAMFASSEGAVGRTKLQWWSEDLARGRDAAQHPLSRHLLALLDAQAIPADNWRRLGSHAQQIDSHAMDPDSAAQRARWLPFSTALAEVEQGVLGHPVEPERISAQLRFDRLLAQLMPDAAEVSMLPRDLLTRFGAPEHWRGQESSAAWTALAVAWAAPVPTCGSTWRRLRQRLQQRCWARLRRGFGVQRASELPGTALLWHTWRAAQQAGVQATPHSHVRS